MALITRSSLWAGTSTLTVGQSSPAGERTSRSWLLCTA